MTTPNIEELITYLRSFFIDENVSAIKANQIANALQSQAERIAELEEKLAGRTDYALSLRRRLDTARMESHTLRAQLADAELHTKQVERGLDKATAQLEAIAATEPSMIYHGRCVIDCGDSGHHDVTMLKMIARETKLFTRPMPTQRLTELKLLMLTTAYEQGVGKGIQRRDCNPYAADTDEHAVWKLGYEEGLGLRRI